MDVNLTNVLLTALVGGVIYVIIRKMSSNENEKFHKCCEQFDYKNQSRTIKIDNVQVKINKDTSVTKDNKIEYLTNFTESCKTLYDVFPAGAKLSVDGMALGNIRPKRDGIDWIAFKEVLRQSKLIADGLWSLGLREKNTFGIYSINSSEYTIFEYACYRHSLIVIPIYETLGSNVCGYIAKQAELSAIYCDKIDRVDNILKNVADFQSLKHIIVGKKIEDKDADLKKNAEIAGMKVYSVEDIVNSGSKASIDDHPPSINDLAVVCYTSGTTDLPKGVMLTHQNVVAGFSAIQAHLCDYRLNETDTVISYLPLGHMFERVCEWGTLSAGGKVGYFGGDIKHLSDDMKIIKPTMLPCVPRVLNKIYARIQEQTNSNFIKRTLIGWAYSAKKKQLQNRTLNNNTLWDKLVFSKIRALLGGRVRIIPVGSAPMNGTVLDFLRCALGCNILEGYGQTECVAAASVTLLGDYTTGHVGVPLRAAAIKLEDVPEMGYFVKDGKGEVCIKGSIVFQGYLKEPTKTTSALDSHGWLHTGDIGTFTETGALKILDRKKDIFKLSQGEYIAPAKIEDVYARNPYVLQIFVYGDSLKACLVAIVVPNMEMIFPNGNSLPNGTTNGHGPKKDDQTNSQTDGQTSTASSRLSQATGTAKSNKNCAGNDLKEMELKKFLFDQLIEDGKKGKLVSYEQVRDIYIEKTPFSIENGLLTPTLKNKRFELKKYYQKQIDVMYKQLE